MAEVFIATREGRVHALKRVLPEFAADAVFLNMFLDEMRIVSRISHPGICTLHDSGQVEGVPFFTMDFVPGVNLWALVRKGHPLPVALAVSVVAKVAGALGFAHELADERGRALGIVHRDVTPHNVMVSFEGDVKLLDFGIAKARTQAERTRTGVLKGKYAYMSPEQMMGGEVDARSDLFSLGTVLFEALTGARPFGGGSASEQMEAVRRCAPPSPVVLRPDLDPELATIVLKSLARRPEDRFQSGAQMEVALIGFLAGRNEALAIDRLPGFLAELFPKRHKAIGDVMAEVQGLLAHGINRSAASTKPSDATPSAAFEDQADDLDDVALTMAKRSKDDRMSGGPSEPARRRRPQRRVLALSIITGILVGVGLGVSLYFAIRSPLEHAQPQREVRQLESHDE
jgi:serine/threonine protein kinase